MTKISPSFSILIASLFLAACDQSKPIPGHLPPEESPICQINIPGSNKKYQGPAQFIGIDFGKLIAKYIKGITAKNEYPEFVEKIDSTISENSVRCLIVAQLQACAITAKSIEIQNKIQETVEKACSPMNADLGSKEMLQRLESGNIETQHYSISPARALPELVDGKHGAYFFVDIKTDPKKQTVLFDPGEYTVDALEPQLNASLNAFFTEIIEHLDIPGRQIYIRGSADAAGNSTFSTEYKTFDCNVENPSNIDYHQKIDEQYQKYQTKISNKLIGTIINNNDLPFLRARFIQCKIRSMPHAIPTDIIEGTVSRTVNEAQRKGTFILYIPKK